MKKISLVLAMGALAVFTACGDDSSSSPAPAAGVSGPAVSCDITTVAGGISSRTCMEAAEGSEAAPVVTAACQSQADMKASMEQMGGSYNNTFAAGTGCPAGATKVCTSAATGITSHYYDAGMEGFDCSMLE
ncbi:MAG: hypothetical protein MJY82_09200 [Fibrobacter sp.]|nr:hypothetical protein [Fibrobacter sp.]